MRIYTYIAGDHDHDINAINHIYWLRKNGYIRFYDAHDLKQSYDTSLSCSIKKSLKYRMDNSYKFILVVGDYTNTVTKGGCQLCRSYNSHTYSCGKNNSIDYRSYIKFECDKAVETKMKIVVLYYGTIINRTLCPESIRYKGIHINMLQDYKYGTSYWNDEGIINAIG